MNEEEMRICVAKFRQMFKGVMFGGLNVDNFLDSVERLLDKLHEDKDESNVAGANQESHG